MAPSNGHDDATATATAGRGEGPDRWPDFFIIGAAKSGTTTLHDYLARHPALWMSPVKEPRFFDPSWPLERRDPRAYRKLFEGAADNQLRAESSVNYSMWPRCAGVPEQIAAANPQARFIYLLREPIARCYSHFTHRYERERFPGQPYHMTFEEYLEFEPVIADASDYEAQIRQYLEYFPRSSLLVLSFERFVQEPAWTLRKVLNFLGVDDLAEELANQPVHSNSTSKLNQIMTRRRLVSPLRRVPGLHFAYSCLPSSLRERSVALLQNSLFGRRVERRFTPPPILPATREKLQERFDASTKYLVAEFGFDPSFWAKPPTPSA